LQAESLGEPIKRKLREVEMALDPLQLLEEVRAMQSHLVVLADGEKIDAPSQQPNLAAFLASLSAPGEPERSARLTVWNLSRAICDRYNLLFIATPALRVKQIAPAAVRTAHNCKARDYRR